jgi:hypothetical protein
VARVAVGLLPGLIEAVDRAVGVGVVWHAGRELERSIRQRGRILDTRIDRALRQSGGAGGQQTHIARQQAIVDCGRELDGCERRWFCVAGHGGRAAGVGRWQRHVGARLRWRGAEMRGIGGLELRRLVEVRPGCAVFVHNALRQQVHDRLVVLRYVGREQVIE